MIRTVSVCQLENTIPVGIKNDCYKTTSFLDLIMCHISVKTDFWQVSVSGVEELEFTHLFVNATLQPEVLKTSLSIDVSINT